MECLSYVDLSHDYSKSITFNNMSPHYRHMYLYPPPFKLCHLCQMYMKPQVRPAGPISWSPLLPLLWEFNNGRVIMSPFSSLSPSPYLLMLSLIMSSPSSSLFSYSTSPPLCPLLPAIPIWNKKYFLIWNWIRSCSSINSPMICYEEFCCLVGAQPATPPRGRPSNRLTFTMTPTSLRLKRVKTKVNTSLIDWLIEIAILWIVKNANTVIHLHISSYAYMHQQVLFYSNNLCSNLIFVIF